MERRVVIGLDKNNTNDTVFIPNASEAALRTAVRMAPHRIVIYEAAFEPYALAKVKRLVDNLKSAFGKNYFIFR